MARPVSTFSYVRVINTLNGAEGSGVSQNRFDFSTGGVTPGGTFPWETGLAAAFQAFYTSIAGISAWDAHPAQQIYWYPAGGGVPFKHVRTPAVVDGAGDEAPLQAAAIIDWSGSQVGAGTHGYTSIGPLTADAVDASNQSQISAAAAATLNSAAGALITALAALSGITYGVFSNPHFAVGAPFFYPITQHRVRLTLGTRRSRLGRPVYA